MREYQRKSRAVTKELKPYKTVGSSSTSKDFPESFVREMQEDLECLNSSDVFNRLMNSVKQK